jgi:hypothetical protein
MRVVYYDYVFHRADLRSMGTRVAMRKAVDED